MRRIFHPILTDVFNTTNHPGATGEMIRCAQAIGAEVGRSPLYAAAVQVFAANPRHDDP